LYGGKSTTNEEPPDNTPKVSSSNKNLADFISTEPSLSSFNKLLVASGENNTLKGTSTSYIVIAPSNKAYKVLPAGYYDSLLTTQKQVNAQNIVKYEIVAVTTDQLTAGQKLKTTQGQEVIVSKEGNKFTFTDAKGNVATALKNPIKTSNGSLIIVDNVLLPQ
jgi:uncharacterized surface protein with fasciclin (FAS1) repeats